MFAERGELVGRQRTAADADEQDVGVADGFEAGDGRCRSLSLPKMSETR